MGRPPAGGGADPYGLEAVVRCWGGRCQGLLLVAPRCRPPRRCSPGPVVGGLPVGLVFGDRPAELRPWLDALVQDSRRPADGVIWAVLSPWNGHHLPVARQLRRGLRNARFGVEGWFADCLTRAGLLAHLARGPDLAFYLGHGSPWGLDAFGGVDLASIGEGGPWRSCGSLALLACRTAAPRGSAPGFATVLLAEGRVLSCLAAVADVEQGTNAALARRLVRAFADGARSLGACVAILDRELGSSDPRRRTLRAYRLLGLPLQPVRAVGSVMFRGPLGSSPGRLRWWGSQ